MELYLLKDKEGFVDQWDCMIEIVVRASTAKKARQVAANHCRDEGTELWLDPKQSTCRKVKKDGKEEVITCYILNG